MDSVEVNDAPEAHGTGTSTAASRAIGTLAPQNCPTCGSTPVSGRASAPNYVYAIGRIDARFPRQSVEKEFAQVSGKNETSGLTDRQTLQKVLSERQNRYLARQLCWVMIIGGLETYILVPRDPSDLELFLEALRAAPSPGDLDCVIGIQGPNAPPEFCNGLMVPIVIVDHMYSFHRNELIGAIPRPEDAHGEEFTRAAEEVFDRVMQITDNAGATDEHRALNYLALRYPAIYATAANAFKANRSLTGVNVVPSALGGTRKVVDVIFSFTDRKTDFLEKFFARVDVTEEFPFLRTRLTPYYDR
ncbi:MAG: hypothetical protein JO033_12070 [Acidobacteriaceae bacterium]|nr:hypothetical protein [Acidobacteriaceae bacterium]MBV9502885.1 hypothetical protein [Acidobacteriaceae bacterium]